MTRSAAIAAAYMLAVSQGGAILCDDKAFGPADYLQPRHTSHDAERIAQAEAKRARKAAKRAKLLEAKP
jgi:hypothetical protein